MLAAGIVLGIDDSLSVVYPIANSKAIKPFMRDLSLITRTATQASLLADKFSPGPSHSSYSMCVSDSNGHTPKLILFVHLPDAYCIVLKYNKLFLSLREHYFDSTVFGQKKSKVGGIADKITLKKSSSNDFLGQAIRRLISSGFYCI